MTVGSEGAELWQENLGPPIQMKPALHPQQPFQLSVCCLAVTALDISDSVLMVPQVDMMFVEIPQWVRELAQRDETQ